MRHARRTVSPPDLNPCNLFLWGRLKDTVYRINPTTIADLVQPVCDEAFSACILPGSKPLGLFPIGLFEVQGILLAVLSIPSDMLRSTVENDVCTLKESYTLDKEELLLNKVLWYTKISSLKPFGAVHLLP
ncbi:hypothetical protein AVEN_272435-1 [Araneus ventricosus]|uniref:Uncharacterized protein n=1 Tax=Araneus ventricosus TaxID=182803 RepID=A0A4Y2LKL0_ARAVE|nr:hypothetical protein AVEN_272435-1 [Araneus ventricosus]